MRGEVFALVDIADETCHNFCNFVGEFPNFIAFSDRDKMHPPIVEIFHIALNVESGRDICRFVTETDSLHMARIPNLQTIIFTFHIFLHFI